MSEDIIYFEISVRARKNVTKKGQREWVKLSDSGQDNYGYSPPIDKVTEESVEIYNQRVPSLDISEIVAVVNGIHP